VFRQSHCQKDVLEEVLHCLEEEKKQSLQVCVRDTWNGMEIDNAKC